LYKSFVGFRADVTQKYMKMNKDLIIEGSSQQANKNFINRRNGQDPKHLKSSSY